MHLTFTCHSYLVPVALHPVYMHNQSSVYSYTSARAHTHTHTHTYIKSASFFNLQEVYNVWCKIPPLPPSLHKQKWQQSWDSWNLPVCMSFSLKTVWQTEVRAFKASLRLSDHLAVDSVIFEHWIKAMITTWSRSSNMNLGKEPVK